MIQWIKVDKDNVPTLLDGETSFLFYFDGSVYTGWPLVNENEGLNLRDDDGFPVWEENEGARQFYDVRWFAHWNQPLHEDVSE